MVQTRRPDPYLQLSRTPRMCPSIHPTVDVLACMDDGFGCVVSACVDSSSSCVVPSGADSSSSCAISVCDVTAALSRTTSFMTTADTAISIHDIMAAPDHATSAPSTPDMPFFVYPPWTSSSMVLAQLAPWLPLCHSHSPLARHRMTLDAPAEGRGSSSAQSSREPFIPPTLQRIQQSAYGKIRLERRSEELKKSSTHLGATR